MIANPVAEFPQTAERSVYRFSATAIEGYPRDLAEFAGKALLIVNTASHCGFTPQYAGLEQLYRRYRDRGFEVLGFPCNQFGAQEPGEDAQIAQFCSLNFGVSFPLFAKVEVNGPEADPLFTFLKQAKAGLFGTHRIQWNFTKFLVNRQGQPVARFAPLVAPANLARSIERLL